MRPRKIFIADLFTSVDPTFRILVYISIFLQGAGSSHPKFDRNF